MDARFDTSKDPRFKRIPGNVRKVEVDERFAHMFNDKRFVETPAVDARGRKIKPDMEKQRLKSFYQFGDGQETKMPTKRGKRGGRKAKRGNPGAGDAKNPRVEGSTTLGKDKDVEQAMSNGKVPKKKTKKRSASSKEGGVPSAQGGKSKLKVRSRAKRRREEVDEEAEEADDDDDSSSQDDEEEGEDENEIIAEDSVWRAEAEEVPQGDATRRLAIMGCDWHSISAGDLLVMLRTYLSGKGSKNAGTTALQSSSVEKVSIYPSEFGMERMKVENEKGPMTLKALEDEDNHDSKATEAKQREALRKWQVEQTKYYYAVADCDSAATAAWLYDQLDGITVTGIAQGLLDLRFVPEDLEFPHSPTQVATEAPRKYQGPVVTDNTALGHTNVKCTWDEPAPQRKRDLQKKKFSSKEIQEMYLQDYLATSSEDEDIGAAVGKTDGTSKQKAAELRKQLVGSDSEDGDGDDFFKDLDEEEPRKAKKSVEMEGDTDWVRVSVSANELEEKLAERAQEQTQSKGRKVRKLEGEEQKSVWQQYLDRKKAKRKERKEEAKAQRLARKGTEGAEGQVEGAATKEELEVLFANEDEDRGFNVRGRKRTAAQRAAKEEEPFEVDVEDPRFSKVFSSVDFEIDPTIPEYRPSEGMKLVLSEKRKRKLSGAARKSPADAAGAQQEPAKKTTPARPASQQAAQKKTGGLQLFAS